MNVQGETHKEKMRNSGISGKTEGKRKFRIFKDLQVNQDIWNSGVSAYIQKEMKQEGQTTNKLLEIMQSNFKICASS